MLLIASAIYSEVESEIVFMVLNELIHLTPRCGSLICLQIIYLLESYELLEFEIKKKKKKKKKKCSREEGVVFPPQK